MGVARGAGRAPVSLSTNLQEHLEVFSGLSELAPPVEAAANVIAAALRRQQKLMLCGNGGSAADSQHFAAEFVGRFDTDRKPLAAVALSTDSSAITCIANDYSFDDVFYRQVLALGKPGDCLMAISTSGKSRNVVRAVEAARSLGIHTIGLLGRDGGPLLPLCDTSIVVRSTSTARIQEAHIFICHTLCALIEQALDLA
jgi:D-sedoheptulose 7-phosphate isomerase